MQDSKLPSVDFGSNGGLKKVRVTEVMILAKSFFFVCVLWIFHADCESTLISWDESIRTYWVSMHRFECAYTLPNRIPHVAHRHCLETLTAMLGT